MNAYTLTAYDEYGRDVVKVLATDEASAIFSAIGKTLDRAIKSERWATGRITLTDSEGNLIQEMSAK